MHEQARGFPFGPVIAAAGMALAAGAWAAGSAAPPPADQDAQREVLLIERGLDAQRRLGLELRWAAPVVDFDQVGRTNAESPLVFEPPLPGNFRWLSRRSGVFLSEAGARPGGRWRVRLKEPAPAGVTWPPGARLDREIRAPNLEVAIEFAPTPPWWSRQPDPGNARPTYRLTFSQPVRTGSVQEAVRFRSTQGRVFPAEVWWPGLAQEEAPPESARRFEVRPWGSLPPTAEEEVWELVVDTTVRAVDPHWRLEAPAAVRIGRVDPLRLTGHRVLRDFNQPPCIELAFNHPMAPPEEFEAAAAEWFRLEPAVGPLSVSWTREGCRICLPEGAVEPHRPYRLWISGALRAWDGTALNEPVELEVKFLFHRPRLMAPGFVASQQALEQEDFRLLALNVAKFRVRSKRLDRPALVHALRGFGSYLKEPAWLGRLVPDRTVREALDYNVVPGRTVLDRSVETPPAPSDQPVAVELPWEELLGGERFGAVFLEAAAEGRPDVGVQTIIQRTDLGVLWKRWGRSNLIAQVFSLRTGRPLEGVRVHVVGPEDEVRSEGTTDASGAARLACATDRDWLVAMHGADLCAFRVGDRTARLRSGPRIREGGWFEPVEVLWFADRNLYRPGETAHVKLIARRWVDGAFEPPAGEACEIQAYGPGWKRLWTTNLVLGPLGSADFDWALPRAPRGDYRLGLRLGRQWRSLRLTVADFQPAGFELEIDAPETLLAGETFEAAVKARYLFGAPVRAGRLRWWIESGPLAEPSAGLAGWRIGVVGHDAAEATEALDSTVHEEAARIPDGWRIRQPLPPAAFAAGPRRLVLVVSLTDPAGQTLQERAVTVLQPGRCLPGVRPPADVVHAGETLNLPLAVFDLEGRPWPDPLQATVRVDRVEWEVVRYQAVRGRPAYRHEQRLCPLLEESVRIEPMRRFGQTPEPATHFPFTPPEPGQYRVTVETADPEGRLVRTESSLWVGGPARLAWDFHDAPLLELVPDRPEYEPGQTARLLAKAPFGGQALVSVERDTVLRQFVTRLEGNAPVIEVPIRPGDGPNVFVAVTLLRGAADSHREHPMPDYRHGVCELRVREDERRLGLTLRLDPPEGRPGEPARVIVQARDTADQPVPDAEVTVFAVDEGVLQLGGYTTPDPVGAFLRNRPLGVGSFLSLFNLLDDNPDYWTYPNKGTVIGGGGRAPWTVRRDFAATPLWIAAIRTDAEGFARAAFHAPDSLTRFRVVAVAHTADSRFGLATEGWRVRQPLMITPATPAFARAGDRLLARALVHNQTGQARRIRAVLALGDGPGQWIDPQDQGRPEAIREFELPDAGRRAVEIPVRLDRPGQARWIWRVEAQPTGQAEGGAVERDAVEVALAVAWPTPPRTQTLYAVLEGGQTNLLAGADPALLEGEGRIRVKVSDSAGLELEECFRQLLHYPYGCAEQTCSSLIPWILLHRDPELARRLGRSPEEVSRALAKGWQRLERMQTADGGIAYWPGGRRASEWAGAYAALVMALAGKTGLEPPARLREPLLDWLERRLGQTLLRDDTPPGPTLMPGMALLALQEAGRSIDHHVERLFARRFELSAEDCHLLAATLAAVNPADPRGRLFLEAAAGAAMREDPFGSPRRAEATELLARLRLAPRDPATHALARRLLEQRRDGHWGTTQANAWAAWALVEYFAAIAPQQEGPLPGKLTGPDGEQAFTLTEEQPTFEAGWPLNPRQPPREVRLAASGGGPLFVETRIESHSPRLLEASLSQGLSLERLYRKIDNDGRLVPADDLQVGDPVVVTLRLALDRPADYLALVDALPAVLEPVHLPGQGAERPGAPPPERPPTDPDAPRELPVSFREIAADEVRFFADHVPAGRWEVRYVTRVRCGGRVVAPSARAEAMYDPERRGYTAARWFEVEGRP